MLAFLTATFVRRGRWLGAVALGTLWSPASAAGQAARDAALNPGESAVSSAALLPDTVLKPRGGPELIRLVAPGATLTALRLSIPIEEAPASSARAPRPRRPARGWTGRARRGGSRTRWWARPTTSTTSPTCCARPSPSRAWTAP